MEDRNGYTLLELLISISLIAMILLIIGGAMRLGFRSVDSGERKVESLERYKASLDIMDSQIQSAFLMREGEPGNPERAYAFKGSRETMEFPSNRSLWGGQRGYVAVAYTIEADGNGKKTLNVSESFIGAEKKTETKLLAPVDDIYFEYFPKGPLEEKARWADQWTDKEYMPGLVKVTITDRYGKLAFIVPVRTANTPVSGGL